MSVVDDRELAYRVQQGDGEAFGMLVRRHQHAVFNVALRLLGSRQAAEDMTQETFLRAYRAFAGFDPERPLAPWLKRIATNLCLNLLQSAGYRRQLSASELGRPGETTPDMDRWPGRRPTPEQALIGDEAARRLRQAILQLPPRYRAVIELRHFQDLSYDQMADVLERSLSNVKSDLFRARKMLAQLLKE